MSIHQSIEVQILKYLYLLETKKELKKSYKREIARNIGISEKAAYTYLKTLLKNGYIEVSGQKGIQRFYKLTDKGRALAWALLNPDALADLYRMEETARVAKVREYTTNYELDVIEKLPLIAEQWGFPLTDNEKKKLKAISKRMSAARERKSGN